MELDKVVGSTLSHLSMEKVNQFQLPQKENYFIWYTGGYSYLFSQYNDWNLKPIVGEHGGLPWRFVHGKWLNRKKYLVR